MTTEQTSESPTQQYIFDNAWQQQRQRLAALEAWLDPGTTRHLEALGVSDGWHCLEVGAGGGSIAAWLSARVGPSGRVVATDLDTRFVEALDQPNLEVRRHNIVTDALEAGAFDLVHVRFLLLHLPEREAVLRKLVAALKPGGWLLVEEPDFISGVADPTSGAEAAALFDKVYAAHLRVQEARGIDTAYGRRLLSSLDAAGLSSVNAEGRASILRFGPGSTGHVLGRLTFVQLREPMIEAGLVTQAEFEALMALLDDPRFTFMTMVVMAASGQRPLGG